MKVRHIVTGHDNRGKSVFKSDGVLDPLTLSLVPGVEFHRVWGAEQAPTLPNFESVPATATFFPAAGGMRVTLSTFPVEPARPLADLDVGEAMAEAERKVPGLLSHMEPGNRGMHTTQTVDVNIVLSGELILELDDGAETLLRTGDIVVQNGTRHRWHNRGSVPAVLAGLMVGANRAE